MIDLHCHLDLYADPKSVIEECVEDRAYVLAVTTTPLAWTGLQGLIAHAPRIRPALGIHPEIAHTAHADLGVFHEMLPHARYVGEVGLDGSPEFIQYRQQQLRIFNGILEACQIAGGRILSIHSRAAASDVLGCLDEHRAAGTVILHWFSGTKAELARAVRMGCWFSVGPAMVRSEKGRSLIAAMPMTQVLPESDGPFVSVKGRPAVPQDTIGVMRALAQIWNMTELEARSACHENLQRLVT